MFQKIFVGQQSIHHFSHNSKHRAKYIAIAETSTMTIIKATTLIFLSMRFTIISSATFCNICHDGSYPGIQNAQVVILPGYMPRTRYSCAELYNLGLQDGGINDQLCNPLVDFAAEPCGCGEFNPNTNGGGGNTNTWTAVGSGGSTNTWTVVKPNTPVVAASSSGSPTPAPVQNVGSTNTWTGVISNTNTWTVAKPFTPVVAASSRSPTPAPVQNVSTMTPVSEPNQTEPTDDKKKNKNKDKKEKGGDRKKDGARLRGSA